MQHHIASNLSEAAKLIAWLQDDRPARQSIVAMATALAECLRSRGRILTCGNGGSMCDAMHFAEELSGRYRKDRPALAAMSICDPSHLTCVANDFGFDRVFARGVEAWGRAGDVLIGFSTSGNSRNVIAAAESARQLEMKVFGLLGRDGGKLAEWCDESIIVPAQTSDRIQEVHIKIVHTMIELIERDMFPENYR